MKDRPRVQDFDWTLLAIVAAICGMGVMEIYSSTHASAMAGMQWKQLTWLGIGIVGMFIISQIDYHTLLDQAPILYICGVAGLLVVMVIGSTHLGAKRWISMGGIFNLQVSELMKLIIIIVLARFFSEVRTDRLTLSDLVKVGALTIVPAALILKQPDLGTALVLVPVAIVGAFIAGIEWRHMAIGIVLVALLIPVGWNMRHHLKTYQQQRIETFLTSGRRSARRRISDFAVGNCRGFRWFLGQRIRQRQPEPIGLCARPLFGLHTGGAGRGTGLHRSLRGVAVVSGSDSAAGG